VEIDRSDVTEMENVRGRVEIDLVSSLEQMDTGCSVFEVGTPGILVGLANTGDGQDFTIEIDTN